MLHFDNNKGKDKQKKLCTLILLHFYTTSRFLLKIELVIGFLSIFAKSMPEHIDKDDYYSSTLRQLANSNF